MHVCGIVGVFYKRGSTGLVGQVMTDMCDPLFRRGPDSAGVALYGPLLQRPDHELPQAASSPGAEGPSIRDRERLRSDRRPHRRQARRKMIARACGKNDVHDLEAEDMRALTLESSLITGIPLAGTDFVLTPEAIADRVAARLAVDPNDGGSA